MKALAYTSSKMPLRESLKVQGGGKMDVDQPAWIFGLRDRKLSHYFQGFINSKHCVPSLRERCPHARANIAVLTGWLKRGLERQSWGC